MEIKEFVKKLKKELKKDCHKGGRNCDICGRVNKIIDTLVLADDGGQNA